MKDQLHAFDVVLYQIQHGKLNQDDIKWLVENPRWLRYCEAVYWHYLQLP